MESGFSEGDIIKSPTSQSFAELTVTPDSATWKGSLSTTNYKNMYMMRVRDAFNTTVEGKPLNDEQRTLTIRKGWNSIAYLLSEPASTRDALADYYDKATVGDIIKSRTQFAVFTENNKWEGSLQTLRPGQGYLLRRFGEGSVTMKYVKNSTAQAPKKANSQEPMANSQFSNPKASSNMTMICKMDEPIANGQKLMAFIADELVGVATPIDSLYFLTIQSDVVGSPIEFRTDDGTVLSPVEVTGSRDHEITYIPDSHHGSLRAPVVLTTNDELLTTKIIENNHVIIIRNNEKYDVTGKKL